MARAAFLLVGVFVTIVGTILLVAPGTYIEVFAVTYVPGMDFAARRFAPAVLALGVLLILARNLEPGSFRTALMMITALAFVAVAATGFHAWSSGVAKPGILAAAAFEIAVATVFAWLALSGKRS